MTGAIRTIAHGATRWGEPSVIAWPDNLQRRRLPASHRGGGGRRGRRQPAGCVVLWSRRYWPQRPEHIDAAISQTYRLRSHGLIDPVEVEIREFELHIMRGWVR
jgi:hypothetical protein